MEWRVHTCTLHSIIPKLCDLNTYDQRPSAHRRASLPSAVDMRDAPPAGLIDPPEWLAIGVRNLAPFLGALLYIIAIVGLAVALHPNTERHPIPRFLLPLRNWILQPVRDAWDRVRPRRD